MEMDYAFELKKLHEERNKKHYDWLKNVILMASGLIGILVSLHSVKSVEYISHLLFSSTILLLGIGILSGTIYLYAEIDVYNHHLKLLDEARKNIVPNGKDQERIILYAGVRQVYVLMKYVAFFSFVLAIPSLIAYAIFLDCL